MGEVPERRQRASEQLRALRHGRSRDDGVNLEMAGKNLSRQSFLDASENMCKFLCSTCDAGYAPSTSPTDHAGSETLYINIEKNGKWERIGDPVSFESTPNCTPMTPPEGFDQQPKVGYDAPYVETP